MSSLRRGDRGIPVAEIRAALAALGLLDSSDADLTTGKHVAFDVFDDDWTMRSARSSSTVGCWSTAWSARPPTAR